jgi:hypothetical protein
MVLIVTEAGKLRKPPSREASQEFRSSTRHVGTTYKERFRSNRRPVSYLFQCDCPFGRKSGIFSLREVSNERGRLAFFDHISTSEHYRIVKLADDCTSFRPRLSLPVETGIYIGKIGPVRDVGEQAPHPATGELRRHGIREGGR